MGSNIKRGPRPRCRYCNRCMGEDTLDGQRGCWKSKAGCERKKRIMTEDKKDKILVLVDSPGRDNIHQEVPHARKASAMTPRQRQEAVSDLRSYGIPVSANKTWVSDHDIYRTDYDGHRTDCDDHRIRCPVCKKIGYAEHGSRWSCTCGTSWVALGNSLRYWTRSGPEIKPPTPDICTGISDGEPEREHVSLGVYR